MTDCSKNNLKVTIENFQSISKGELEFTQGINIIVGQSNSGKSAILRALKGAVLNTSGSQKYIKNGTKGFKVGIDYQGNSIEWSRTLRSPEYVINGEKYAKIGSSNLLDFLDNSGFTLDENKSLMNVESELELPFPFDKSNNELFKLFEKNIFCISDSTAITKLIKSDEEETASRKDNAEYELTRLQDKLAAIEELEKEVDLNWLVGKRGELANLASDKEKLLLDIQNLHGIISLGKVIGKGVPHLSQLPDLQDYISLSKDIETVEQIRGVGNILSQSVPTASTPTVSVSEFIELKNDINELENADKVISILSPLEAPLTIGISDEYTSLRNDINTLSRLREQAQMIQNNITEKRQEIQLLEDKKSKFKVCPLCGGSLNG